VDKRSWILNQGIIAFNNILTTSLALFLQQGKASGHPENVSARTSSYLCCLHFGNSEKSICQYSLGAVPLFTSPTGGFLWILGLFTQQIWHLLLLHLHLTAFVALWHIS